jgi:peptidoglycan/xylan/chitin deacetylase (PgdA/CDA1 family)
VIVTFADGYVDTLHAAKALLQRHEVPATFFVTTEVLASGREFWWDDIDRLFLQTRALPRTLSLTIGGEAYQWDLGEDADYHEDVQRLHRHWRAWGEPDPTVRHYLFRTIYSLLYPLPANERQSLVHDLLAWGGLPYNPADRRTLTPGELLELGSGSLMGIGAHTVTHSLLVAALAAIQQLEIQPSTEELACIPKRPVTSFAYPLGKHGAYSEETVDLVRVCEFSSACSNFPGVIRKGEDVYQLPRTFIGNWDADEFARQLAAWFDN